MLLIKEMSVLVAKRDVCVCVFFSFFRRLVVVEFKPPADLCSS